LSVSDSKFVFDLDIPPIIRREIEAKLGSFDWLIPGWCQRVFVGWDDAPSDPDEMISCLVDYEYRKARVTFCPRFLAEGDRQIEDAIHDLLHGFSCPLFDYARDRIEALLPEDGQKLFRDCLVDELRVRHEGFIQDLAFALARKLSAAE